MKLNSADNPLLHKLFLMLTAPETLLISLDHKFSQEFELMREFIHSTQRLLDAQSSAIQEKWDAEEKKYEGDLRSQDHIAQTYGGDLYANDFVYRKMLMNMAFVSAVSMFEAFLKKFCEVHYQEFSKTVDDVKGNANISRYRKYIQDIIGLDLQPLEKLWQHLLLANEARNLIIHEYSDLAREKAKLPHQQNTYRFLSSSAHITIEEHGSQSPFYINHEDFILEFIELSEIYLTQVFRILRKKKDSVKAALKASRPTKKNKK